MIVPSASTPASRCAGCDPMASLTPNSRVRPLTEKARTPATPTAAIASATAPKPPNTMALRRVGVSQDLGTDIFQRARALDRLFRGERAHHLRNRRDERVRVGPRVHEQPPEA